MTARNRVPGDHARGDAARRGPPLRHRRRALQRLHRRQADRGGARRAPPHRRRRRAHRDLPLPGRDGAAGAGASRGRPRALRRGDLPGRGDPRRHAALRSGRRRGGARHRRPGRRRPAPPWPSACSPATPSSRRSSAPAPRPATAASTPPWWRWRWPTFTPRSRARSRRRATSGAGRRVRAASASDVMVVRADDRASPRCRSCTRWTSAPSWTPMRRCACTSASWRPAAARCRRRGRRRRDAGERAETRPDRPRAGRAADPRRFQPPRRAGPDADGGVEELAHRAHGGGRPQRHPAGAVRDQVLPRRAGRRRHRRGDRAVASGSAAPRRRRSSTACSTARSTSWDCAARPDVVRVAA